LLEKKTESAATLHITQNKKMGSFRGKTQSKTGREGKHGE